MELDLRLLPFDYDNGDFAYSVTVLSLERDYALFDQIKELPALTVPPRFNTFCGKNGDYSECYGNTQKTSYGEKLTYTQVRKLLKCKIHADIPQNKAVWAYLAQLPPDTKVALYWH